MYLVKYHNEAGKRVTYGKAATLREVAAKVSAHTRYFPTYAITFEYIPTAR